MKVRLYASVLRAKTRRIVGLPQNFKSLEGLLAHVFWRRISARMFDKIVHKVLMVSKGVGE